MGYTYTNSGALCCDHCGMSGGVRKMKCPHGWCPPPAFCPKCRKTQLPLVTHDHCKEHSAVFNARRAREEALWAAGQHVRCSAMGIAGERVHVLFRNVSSGYVGFYMPKAAYDAIPLHEPATPDDYRKHGTLEPAPRSYY